MKLFKRTSKVEESIKSPETARKALGEKALMLHHIESEKDLFRRWQYIYNELRPVDIVLLIAIKLFFDDSEI